MLTRLVGHSDQDGSMPLALLAAIIGMGIITVLFSTVLTSQRTVQFDRDFTTAFHGAETGLQEALVEIRTLEEAGSPPSTITGNGQMENVTFDYEAVKDGFTWEVQANGSVDGGPVRNVEAEVTRDSRFTMAAFGKTLVGFRGGNGAGSYNATAVETGRGTVGTNGEIHLRGSMSYESDGTCDRSNTCVDEINLFGSATCAQTSSNCELLEDEDRIAGEPAPHKPSTDFIEDVFAQEWCTDSVEAFRSGDGMQLEGGGGPGPEGEYCFTSMSFDHASGNLPIEGTEPAVVYVSGTVSSVNDSIVNCDACEALPSNPSHANIRNMLATDPPDARRLQIYSTGTDVALGNHTHMGAAIYAPNASCHGNPSNAQGYIYGSMLCNDINNQGGWSFWYDERLEEIAGSTWRLSDLREEVGGSSSFD